MLSSAPGTTLIGSGAFNAKGQPALDTGDIKVLYIGDWPAQKKNPLATATPKVVNGNLGINTKFLSGAKASFREVTDLKGVNAQMEGYFQWVDYGDTARSQ